MPGLGDILSYKDYEFEDGSKQNKFFIVLSDSPCCLVLKTTSQTKRYQHINDGCNQQKRVFSIPIEPKEFFDLPTFVQLPKLEEFTSKQLLQGSFHKQITIINLPLSSQCVQKLLKCLRHFRDDISLKHWKVLFS